MTEIFLQVGKLVSDVDKASGKANKFTVTTPTAVAGIRGTRQEISFGEGFGTECKIENGQGDIRPVSVENLPPAVQMALGVGAAAQEASAKVQEAAQQQAAAPGAEPGAAVAEAAAQAQEKVAEALDQWLSASFDAMVSGSEPGGEDAGPGEGGPEGGEPQMREEAPLSAEMEQMMNEMLEGGSFADEEADIIVIDDGLEAAIIDASDFDAIIDPEARMIADAITDISAAGTSDAEAEALLISTEFSDATASEEARETADDPSLLNDLRDSTADDLDISVADLFGTPPDHP